MGKKGGHQKKHSKNSTTSSRHEQDAFLSDNIDDEIDTFHKQRDIVPLDINDDDDESDEDDELPIFDIKDVDENEDEDDDEDDDANNDVAKMIRQRNFLRAKFGEGDDEINDDDEDEEDYNKLTFGGKRFSHGAENRNFELQSSDDEAPKEEEELALQMQREKARSLTMEDYDLVDISVDKDNEKFTSKDESDKDKGTIKSTDGDITFNLEDLNALSKEEQMKVMSRSAPELVGWLSELNEAHKQIECKIYPFLSKVKKGAIVMEGGVQYFELKQLLLLSYCQAITFYLLLNSEGQPLHNHPVIARLEEIKNLLDQIKQIDSKLPVELEDILTRSNELEGGVKSDNENASTRTNSFAKNQEGPLVSDESPEEVQPHKLVEIQKLESSKDNTQKARKDKHQKDRVSMQSLEMLKVRASLEDKLKQKGLYSSVATKPSSTRKRLRPVNGQLESHDDFDDDAADVKGDGRLVNGSSKVSQFLNANLKKPKVVSGDDDLPKRDDIGKRRRKHELQVLAGAGVKTEDDDNDDDQMNDVGSNEVSDEADDIENDDSENEFYKQVEQQRAEKLAAKAAGYSRNPAVPSSLPETVEGKRFISTQMLKNRGLTRSRNKDKKNPRKNYKLKHQKAVKNRKGQVQSIRKATTPYGGELSGINANVSRSIRFKG